MRSGTAVVSEQQRDGEHRGRGENSRRRKNHASDFFCEQGPSKVGAVESRDTSSGLEEADVWYSAGEGRTLRGLTGVGCAVGAFSKQLRWP